MNKFIVLSFLVGVPVVGQGCKARQSGNQSATESAAKIGQISGFEEIEVAVKSRLFVENQDFYRYNIHQGVNPATTKLSASLGGFADRGQIREYLNGDPNPLSAYLWSNIFASFAERVGDRCDEYKQGNFDLPVVAFDPDATESRAVTLQFKPNVGELLGNLCGTGDRAAEFFDVILPGIGSYNASLKQAWLGAYFASSTPGAAPAPTPSERLKQMLYETLLNPYVLMRYQ